MNRILYALLAILAAAILGWISFAVCESDWCLVTETQRVRVVDSFEDCVRLGFPVMESYPRQCRAGGKHFVEEIDQEEDLDDGAQRAWIGVSEPVAHAEITSPVTVRGEANVFENNISIRIVDDAGNMLAETFTTGLADLAAFGPYEAVVTYSQPTTATGQIEVYGESAEDGSVEHMVAVPVRFGETGNADD